MNTFSKGPSSVGRAETRGMVGVTTWREKGVCDGKHGAKGDGCGGAARGSGGDVGGILGTLKRGDTSARDCAQSSVGQGLKLGTSPRHVGGDGGPGWPIGLTANCGHGGVHGDGTLDRSGHADPVSYGIGVISGYMGRAAVNSLR